jgi:hypothetical protein
MIQNEKVIPLKEKIPEILIKKISIYCLICHHNCPTNEIFQEMLSRNNIGLEHLQNRNGVINNIYYKKYFPVTCVFI